VVRLLEILHDEIDRTLALIGRPGVSTLDASAIWTPPAQPWVRTGRGAGEVLEPVGRS
jgi:isopentenyl diphosphate isomerase/L-lactate dehydrogenase-like FMN-dependent dehydrogenase